MCEATTSERIYSEPNLSRTFSPAVDQKEATHHHLRKNIFRLNQQGTASPNGTT
jgi:hypothetical protein